MAAKAIPGQGTAERESRGTMSFEYESERKEFVKTGTEIPVRYKFLSREVDLGETGVFEGTTSRISSAGFLSPPNKVRPMLDELRHS